jgi:hypothetical protein
LRQAFCPFDAVAFYSFRIAVAMWDDQGQLLEKLSGMSVKWVNFDSLPVRHESYGQVKFL